MLGLLGGVALSILFLILGLPLILAERGGGYGNGGKVRCG